MASAAQTSFPFSEDVRQGTRLGDATQQRTGLDVGTASSRPPLRTGRERNASTSLSAGGVPFDSQELRAWNRTISRNELLPQREQLAAERAALFTKGLDTELTRTEQRQLRYVEWQLDRLDDAVVGDQLDMLAAFVSATERLGGRMDQWLTELRRVLPAKSKHSAGSKRRT